MTTPSTKKRKLENNNHDNDNKNNNNNTNDTNNDINNNNNNDIKNDNNHTEPKLHKVVIVGASFGGNGVMHGLMNYHNNNNTNNNNNHNNNQDNHDEHDLSLKLPKNIHVTWLDQNTTMSIGACWQFHWSSRIQIEKEQPPPKEDDQYDPPVVSWEMKHYKAAVMATSAAATTTKDGKNTNLDFLLGKEHATVTKLCLDANQIELNHGKRILDYDTLVLAPGVVSDPTNIPGLSLSSTYNNDNNNNDENDKKNITDNDNNNSDNICNFCDIHHIPKMKTRLDQLMKDAKTSPKTILVCITKFPYKCPPVPFEVASIVDDMRRERNVKDNVRIIITLPVSFPFGGPKIETLFRTMMKEQDIEFLPNHTVQSIQKDTSTITYQEEVAVDVHNPVNDDDKNDNNKSNATTTPTTTIVTKELTFDLLLCTFPQHAPDFCKPICNDEGFIPVDLQTNRVLLVRKDNNDNNTSTTITTKSNTIFAVGDACHAIIPKPKKIIHPKSGEFAYMMGLHVGHQIAASVVAAATDSKVVVRDNDMNLNNDMKIDDNNNPNDTNNPPSTMTTNTTTTTMNTTTTTTVALSSLIPTPKREAYCIAEFGLNGTGVGLQPNFTNVLKSPQTEIPIYETPILKNAQQIKIDWINKYLIKFFPKHKITLFMESKSKKEKDDNDNDNDNNSRNNDA